MRLTATVALLAGLAFTAPADASTFKGLKVLFVDSYHEGYGWSDGITEGVSSIIGNSGAELKVHRMDTKRNTDQAFIEQAAVETKNLIDEWQPDVVIAADDNASKYVIMPHYRDADLPFVFAGVNWDETVYEFPYRNVTGMVEVSAAGELVEILQSMGGGEKIGFIGSNTATTIKEAENQQRVFGLNYDVKLVDTMAEWKTAFIELQENNDIVIVQNNAGINDWDSAEAAAFHEANTKVPTGAFYDFMEPYAVIGFQKVAQEQGEWAAEAALKILAGTAPTDIPITQNQRGRLVVNARIAEGGNISIPDDLVQAAEHIVE